VKQSALSTKTVFGVPLRWWCGLVISVIVHGASLQLSYALSPPSTTFSGVMTLQNGRLTLSVVGVPLRRVLEEFGRLGGTHIRWLNSDGTAPLSITFSEVPVSVAIQRILGENNFLLFYSLTTRGLQLSQIWIASTKAGARPAASLPESSGAALPTTAQSTELEADTESLLQVAVDDPDPTIRLDAVSQLGAYAHEDPRVQAILAQAAQKENDPQVKKTAAEILESLH
jgi:hypothetical protein